MDRRSVIKHAGLAGILAVGAAPAVHAQERVRWRMATSFPKSLPTLHGAAVKFSETVAALSGGKFEVSAHAAGELMPALGVVDAVEKGTLEIAYTAAYYFTGKDPSFAFSCAIPFGMTVVPLAAWKRYGNGNKLLAELFEKYNMLALTGGNTTMQMGGWYRKEINSPEDFKGLKMRMGGGVFGEAMARLGVVPQNIAGGEVYQALEKGSLDAVEFVGPSDDEILGFQKVAPYYYYPGWWEASADTDYLVNQEAFAKLSDENKAILRAAADVAGADMTAKYQALNPPALKRLVASGTKLKIFPKAVIDAGFKATQEVFAENSAESPEFKKIYDDYRAFQKNQILMNKVSLTPYLQYIDKVKFDV